LQFFRLFFIDFFNSINILSGIFNTND